MRIAKYISILLLALPGAALAHATPTEMSPDSGESVQSAKEISIRFSERLETDSSRIKVTDESGANVEKGSARVGEDPRVLVVPIDAVSGVYTVSWSVVSQDDGHFTKGAYAFAVGSSTVASVADSSVVKVKTTPETFAIFVEFLGNSILWGVIVLLIVAIRPALRDSGGLETRVRRTLSFLVAGGVFSGLAGGIAQVFIKSDELASLHGIASAEAVSMYLGTASGEATLLRMGALAIFGVLFFAARGRIFNAIRLSPFDAVLIACLLVFAYFRATISHATANPFFPEFSIFINVLHLIDKDLWFGILIVLVVFALASLHDTLRAIIPRAFSILALNLAAISLTASYIVWLHLRDFSNITSTEWGENFLKLGAAAGLLVAMRVYHVLSLRWKSATFSRWAAFTIAMEMGAAALVVFYSSLVIITSPPAHEAVTHVFSHREPGIAMRLERSPFEDASALLTIKGEHQRPLVRIGEGEGALLVALSERFQGGYAFPLALVKGKDTPVEIIASRRGGYDARTVFELTKDDFETPEGHGRTFDLFTGIIIALALSSFSFALMLEFLGRASGRPDILDSRNPIAYGKAGLILALFAGLFFAHSTAGVLGNDFRALCLEDGNMWHMMQPMKAGVPVSKVPREGCMLSSGIYHFADKREYEYLRSLPEADVIFNSRPEPIQAGEETRLVFSLIEPDGPPAKLSIEHDRILHVIIISEDMSYFAHVHPEDGGALTNTIIQSSVFGVDHTFPVPGTYLIAIDFMHGLRHESKQFRVEVGNGGGEGTRTFSSPGRFGGYDVDFEYITPVIGDVSTLKYTIRKDGKPVESLVPYLSAAMHVAVVKNDLSEFIHTHGEVHPIGYVAPTTLKGHQHSPPPSRFGPIVEAHLIFPSPGMYTVFGEFRDSSGIVVPTSFTVRVER